MNHVSGLGAMAIVLGLSLIPVSAKAAPVELDWAYAWIYMDGVAWANEDDINIPIQYVDPPGFSLCNDGVCIEALGSRASSEQKTSDTYKYSTTVSLSTFASIDSDVRPDGGYGTPVAQAFATLEFFTFSFNVLFPVRYTGDTSINALYGSGEGYSAGDILLPGFYGITGHGPSISSLVDEPGISRSASYERSWNFAFVAVDAPPTPLLLALGLLALTLVRRFSPE